MPQLFKHYFTLLLLGSASFLQAQQIVCSSSCSGALGANIFPDGDFGSGLFNILQFDPGLAPGYVYTSAPPPLDGLYCITNNTSTWGSFAGPNWIKIEDNGPEVNGYMMVVNASYQPGLFYQKTVDLCENTPYEFSMDVISLIVSTQPSFIRPNITFLVDGNPVCETGEILPDEQWHTFKFTFLPAAGQSSVTFGLQNNAPGGNGNDLAMDNIGLRACGPIVTLPGALVNFCPGGPATIQANITNSPYNNPVYLWQEYVAGAWQDIPNSNNPTLVLANPVDGMQLRMLIGNTVSSLSSPNCRIVSDSVVLNQLPDVQVSTSTQAVPCAGGSTGQASATALSGVAPYSYVWSTGQSMSSIGGLQAGIYSVTLSDINGCTSTSTVSVNEPPALSANLSATPLTCFESNDGTASITGSGGVGPFSYLWSNGQTGALISNLSAGNYSVTLTDQHACTFVQSVNVAQHPLVTVSANATAAVCFGQNTGSATATGSGGIAPLSYSWSNGANSASILNLNSGNYLVTVSDVNACTAVTAVNVAEPPLLNNTLSTTAISCAGSSDGAILASANGGTAPYTYLWSNGNTNSGISNLAPGTYSLTVTDANGCTSLSNANLSMPVQMNLSSSLSDVSCFGAENGMASLTVSGGLAPYDFLWSNGQTAASISDLPTGAYTVTVTDKNTCTQTLSLSINSPALLESSASTTDVNCFGGNDASATATVLGGTPPYQYLWTGGQTDASLNSLSAGQYTLTVTDKNGCSTTTQVNVLEPSALLVQSSTQPVQCHGNADGSANTQVSGGVAPYQYLWSDGQSGAQAISLQAGVYQVTVTDLQGCSSLGTVEVAGPDLLTLAANESAVSCFGGADGAIVTQVEGGIAPYNYQWQNGISGANPTNLTAGTYSLTVSDANACTTSIQVTINQAPALLNTITQLSAVLCHGEATGSVSAQTSGGTSPYTYSWSNGGNTAVLTEVPAGTYSLTITDGNDCRLISSAQITEPAALALQTEVQDISCPGYTDGTLSALVNGGVPPYQFVWSTGENTATIDALEAGDYTVQITDANACTTSISTTLSDPIQHTVDLGEDLLLQLGDTLELEALLNIPYSQVMDYTWSGSADSLSCRDCYRYGFQPTQLGCVQVLVRTIKGCLASDQVCYKIDPHKGVYHPNAFSPDGDGLNDHFTIFSDASVKEIKVFSVYNRWGILIYQAHQLKTNDPAAGWDGTYNGELLNPGVFVWIAELEFINGEKQTISGDVSLLR